MIRSNKCSKEANRLKEEGNKLFVAGKLEQSLERYNRALLLVEHQASPDLSLIIANRSAVFFKLKEYLHCLEDISVALVLNYPSDLAYKLQDRRARCFYYLGEKNNFLETLDIMDSMFLEDPAADQKREKMVKELKSLDTEKMSRRKMNVKTKAKTHCDQVNPNFEGLSHLLEMCESRERGRFMIAREDIPAGTVLGAENPVASSLLPSMRGSLCSACFSRLTVRFLPCPGCEARFCGLQCWEEARTGSHRLECGLQTDLANLLTTVKGGDTPPQYYRLCLLAIGNLSVEEVMEINTDQQLDMATVPHQREGDIRSIFNLVR